MKKSIQERIDELTHEELQEIISKMGMNMVDHPYLSEERREQLEREEREAIETFEKSADTESKNNDDRGKTNHPA